MTWRARAIRLALRLQRAPFVWLFRGYYWLALHLVRRLVGGLSDVRSIYVSGSWARQEMLYGLSDIDLKVFVAGDRDEAVYQAIRRRLVALRRLFPMLGSPDEKGIYFLGSFEADYRHFPLVQHLFDARFFRHRLVRGDDLLPRLPVKAWRELDQGECAFARLKDWIERVHVLAGCAELSREQEQHLFFKAVSDVALLALRMESPESAFPNRVAVLEQVSAQVDGPCRDGIATLIHEHRDRYRVRVNDADANLRLFKAMVGFCCERVRQHDAPESGDAGLAIAPVVAEADTSDVAGELRGLSPLIRDVRVTRWPQLPVTPFDLDAFDARACVVDCEQPLDVQTLRALRAHARRHRERLGTVLIREHPLFVSSVNAGCVDQWASFAGGSDLMYRLLGDCGGGPVTPLERRRIEQRVSAFCEQLAAVLAGHEIGRMDLAVFPRFLFNALRVLICATESHHARWCLPATPADTVDFLIAHTPLQPAFPRALKWQYDRAARGGRFDERLVPKSRALLATMADTARMGAAWESLRPLNDLPDERSLDMSVAVVTADRPAQLERCLASLGRLTRRPDEVVVVDGSADDATRVAVEQLQAPCPVRYVRVERRGVACARDRAAHEARGEIVAFVDDDAIVAPDWLERLERAFLRDPRIGIVGGTILNLAGERPTRVARFLQIVERVQQP